MASAPAATAILVSVTACRADGAPVPAITGTSSGSAARTASISITRSASVSVAASAVVPHTSTAGHAPAGQVGRVLAGRDRVDLAVRAEQRDQGHAHATEYHRHRLPHLGEASAPFSGTGGFRLRG